MGEKDSDVNAVIGLSGLIILPAALNVCVCVLRADSQTQPVETYVQDHVLLVLKSP